MELRTELCLPLLGVIMSLVCPFLQGGQLTGYKFPVFTTEFCPRDKEEWSIRSSFFKCPEGHSYVCFPNDNITVLVELCYPLPIVAITRDVCLFLSAKKVSMIDAFNCTAFLNGCPKKPYRASTIYEYPNCLVIENGCFLAQPGCQSSTQTYTEETNTQPTHKKNMTYNKKIPEQESALKIIVIYTIVAVTILVISAGVFLCIIRGGRRRRRRRRRKNSKIVYNVHEDKEELIFLQDDEEVFRCTINITNKPYKDELGDSTSMAFEKLSVKVAGAIELEFKSVQGQQTVKVLQIRPGTLKKTLMVTFELRSKGFKDSAVLRNTLNAALQRKVISTFSVSPVGFEFELFQGNGQQNRSSYTGKIPLEGEKEGDRSEVVLKELSRKLEKRNSTEEKDDDPTIVIKKLEDLPERENVYHENAFKSKETNVTLKDKTVDLKTMKISPTNQPNKKDNVRKEKFKDNRSELPANWIPMRDKEVVKVVTMDKSSAEYQGLETKFLDSVKKGGYNTGKAFKMNHVNNPVGQFNNVKVTKIERIQNPSLYQQYAAKRAHIEQHVDQNTNVLEQDLWHGAASTAIVSINYYGFNRSYCGDNAGEPWYGRGVYFANDASYSARDWVSKPDGSNRKKMYLANVITGHYCAGQKGMKYLPERMRGVNFDCAVDTLNNPLEFVIFNDTQAYPMYCIEFTI